MLDNGALPIENFRLSTIVSLPFLEHLRGIMRKALIILLVLSSMSGLSACNTWRGVGKDIQDAGKAIEDSTKN